jgi:hypothetical protein
MLLEAVRRHYVLCGAIAFAILAWGTMLIIWLGQSGVPLVYTGSYNVPGTAMPWIWHAGGKNAGFQYGFQDGSKPVTLNLSRVGAKPGQSVLISYLGGNVTIGAAHSQAGADGYASAPYGMDGYGPSGKAAPSLYLAPEQLALGGLVAVFSDAAGNLVSAPFAPSTTWLQVIIPPGATQLQFGINDDQYAGNGGHLQVSVQPGPDLSQVAIKVVTLGPNECKKTGSITICAGANGSTLNFQATVLSPRPL